MVIEKSDWKALAGKCPRCDGTLLQFPESIRCLQCRARWRNLNELQVEYEGFRNKGMVK